MSKLRRIPSSLVATWLLTVAVLAFHFESEPAMGNEVTEDPFPEERTSRLKPVLRIESGSRVRRHGAPRTKPASFESDVGLFSTAYEYEALAIEPLSGRARSSARGINNFGQVVGRSHNYDVANDEDVNQEAFVWGPTGGARILGTLSGVSSAWGINDDGAVSGYSFNADGFERAARWDIYKSPFAVDDIGTLDNTSGVSGDSSTAYDLSNLGQITGFADIPNDAGDFMPYHAFLYDHSTGIQDLGTLDTLYPQWQHGYSISYDANNKGEAVGIANNSSWQFRPFIYDAAGGMRELNRDISYGSNEWYAVAINESGLIGGHVIVATDQSFPYYWQDDLADPIQITMPVAFPYGEIYGMNAQGEMVGIMWDATGIEHAFVFDVDKGVRDLNDLIDPTAGWLLRWARDINDTGQIAGTGELDGLTRAFVLNPTNLGALGDELAADFGDRGLWHRNSGAWTKLSKWDPVELIDWQDKIAAPFDSGRGLWAYDPSGWEKLTSWNPYEVVAWHSKLSAAFDSGRGMWLYGSTGWSRITSWEPLRMVAWSDKLAAVFGPGRGLWVYGFSGWEKITSWDSDDIVAWGDKLLAAFNSGRGLWCYEASGWTKLTSWEPVQMVAWGDQLAVAFGAGRGLWIWNSSGWTRITSWDPEQVIACNNCLAADFGVKGLWKFSSPGGWSKLTSWDPEQIEAMADKLAADFGSGRGLWLYETDWTKIASWDPEDMETVDVF